jgi:isoleucyl-tRNA synthetase
MVDERLREIGAGVYNGKPLAEWVARFASVDEGYSKKPEGGESYVDVRRRVGEFLFDVERRYTNKNILIISHGSPLWLMSAVAARESAHDLKKEDRFALADVQEVDFTPYPHDDSYELDLHRPYIDDVPMGNSLDGEWKRVPDVFDCWFESGSMPYASNHYPFAKDTFNPKRLMGLSPRGFPADFIAEGLDQTRGWFYSLIVLGVALFGRSPYSHVIVNGLINASDGKKMSKRLQNYPDPLDLIDKYGVDSLRYYLLSSQLVRGEDLSFQERGVEEVSKKLVMRLDNVASFYELYANGTKRSDTSAHVLDRWIRSRLSDVVRQVTEGYERYELDTATRPLALFIDDLSTWYVRRSRDRFKEEGDEKTAALATLRYVLYTLAHAMAPVMPFFSEELFRRTKEDGDAQSVHLSTWPAAGAVDEALNIDMGYVRTYATVGLKEREAANIKVRQPLQAFTIRSHAALPRELADILKDELNVKEIVFESGEGDVSYTLDRHLTPELKEEGVVRDLARRIQEWRKEQKFSIGDRPDCTLLVSAEEEAVATKHKAALMQQTGLASLDFERAADA